MITAQQIRQDLMEIRYYYVHREELDKAADIIGENATVKKIMRYNQAVADAPPRLYHIYYCLYVMNNSQSALAYEWDMSADYIRQLNCKLLQHLLLSLHDDTL